MSFNVLGEINPALLAQCPVVDTPPNASELPVHVTEWGNEGPTVLLVHGGVQGGIGGGPDNWKGQRALASRGWKMKLIDRPGFGESPSRGSDDMEADAILIAERLGTNSHLVGHSFGGAEALLAAAMRPDAVRSLVLVEPAVQMMLSTDPQSLADQSNKGAADIIVKFLLNAQSPKDYALGFIGALGENDEGDENVVAAGLKANPEQATALGCSLLRARMASAETLRAAADTVASNGIPVMIVTGGYSADQEATGRAVARLTGGRHVVLTAPSHFLQQDCPDAFNDAIDLFLREADADFESRRAGR
jgi:pimeloyl-ACP methyl ester carboxylesterase